MIYEFFSDNVHYPLGDGVNFEPHYKQRDMIKIYIDDKTTLVTPYNEYLPRVDAYILNDTMTEEDKSLLEKNYQAFKEGKPLEIAGSIFKECPLFSQSDIDILNLKKIYTIEQFVQMTDSNVSSLGFGFVQLKNKAKLFLESKNDISLIGKVSNENEKLKAELEQQQQQIAQLMAQQAQANQEILASKKSK
jgi:hypothetical protein